MTITLSVLLAMAVITLAFVWLQMNDERRRGDEYYVMYQQLIGQYQQLIDKLTKACEDAEEIHYRIPKESVN